MELKTRMEDWPSIRPVVLHVYQSAVPEAGRNVRQRTMGNYYAWLLRHGEVEIEDRGRTVHGGAGDWVIAYPGPRHQAFSRDAEILSVQFQAKWPDGCLLFDEGLSIGFPARETPLLEQSAMALLERARRFLPNEPFAIRRAPVSLQQYFAFQHYGSAFLLELFTVLEGKGLSPTRVGRMDERLLVVLRRLDQWPLDLPLDFGHIARHSGLTEDHLSRLFQQHFGMTPVRYFAGRRFDFARRLLGHSATPVKAIAGDLGFRSIADFSAWFKRSHGQSPSRYRQSLMDAAEL